MSLFYILSTGEGDETFSTIVLLTRANLVIVSLLNCLRSSGFDDYLILTLGDTYSLNFRFILTKCILIY